MENPVTLTTPVLSSLPQIPTPIPKRDTPPLWPADILLPYQPAQNPSIHSN